MLVYYCYIQTSCYLRDSNVSPVSRSARLVYIYIWVVRFLQAWSIVPTSCECTAVVSDAADTMSNTRAVDLRC